MLNALVTKKLILPTKRYYLKLEYSDLIAAYQTTMIKSDIDA